MMPLLEAKRLFNLDLGKAPFSSRTGSGLGLYIVRQGVESLKGQVDFEWTQQKTLRVHLKFLNLDQEAPK